MAPFTSSSRLSLAAVALSLLYAAEPAHAFQAVPIGTFNNPVDIQVAPGQGSLLFVVEQPGRILLLRNEVPVATPFLDIRSIVLFEGERGLLSLAFAPDYATSRRFYVQFVNKRGNVEIDEFQRSTANPLLADRASRRVLLVIPHPNAANHNGGQVHFGPGGLLYISVGDGGATATPGQPARDLKSLLGKILRINPLPGGGKPYQIPPDNPYVGRFGRDEIYAYGLRNPWRYSLTATVMAIGDVGAGSEEEIDMMRIADVKGVNFGWPQWEGNMLHDNSSPGQDPPKFPIHTYSHADGCAVMGGHIVSDTGLPTLRGRYIYGDLCTGDIRSFIPNLNNQTARDDRSTGVSLPGLVTFGKGIGGQVYMADNRTVYRLEP
jgi:glucose/arabinose dehydrogenase